MDIDQTKRNYTARPNDIKEEEDITKCCQQWNKCLDKWIQANGEYFERDEKLYLKKNNVISRSNSY